MPHQPHPYDDLPRTPANFVALSPLSFVARSAAVHPAQTAILHGTRRLSWAEVYRRCRQAASQLQRMGIGRNDTVSTLLPNVPAMIEAHYFVPMAGAVLNTLNIRLDAEALAFQLNHAQTRLLLVDPEFAGLAREVLKQVDHEVQVLDVADALYTGGAQPLGTLDYEDWLAAGDPDFQWSLPGDEWQAISLNYTSGTTGNPKGVVYHHRGAYLAAVSNLLAARMADPAVYLWTLPLFHCNGWCFAWSLAANSGTQVCLRRVEPLLVLQLMAEHRVTHLCGAPIVYSLLMNVPAEQRPPLTPPIQALVAGAAPPAAILEGMRQLGLNVCHVYGLTETYGPAGLCAGQPDWAGLSIGEQAQRHGRQGVPYPLQEAMQVMDPEQMTALPAGSDTLGEIMFRGNLVMKGYLKNPDATAAAFAGGWFHSGDLAVCEADGYAKIKDRAKDIIISGGENISSLEIEEVLYRHPAVMAAAVIAAPDPQWGEVPWAFVELKPGSQTSAEALLAECTAHLARFKRPKKIILGEIPKTSTGKLQKFVLRERVRAALGELIPQ